MSAPADVTTAELSREIDERLSELVRPGTELALVNFPNVDNPGDSAIWLGARAALDRAGARVVFACEPRAYRRRLLRRAVGERGTILIQGGGNLGDLYWRAGQQTVRMRVLRDFPRARVIQLPQSLWFRRERRARRFADLALGHPGLTLMLRDEASVERAAALGLDAVRCPDLAFALGPLERAAEPELPVLWLGRQEVERLHERPAEHPGVEVRDWPTGREQRAGAAGGALRRQLALLHALTAGLGRFPRADAALLRLAARRYGPLARRRLVLATEILSRGRVVVSDRFHGHALACMMGIPNVLLDNAYGKNRAVYESWTSRYACAEFAEDPEAALRAALRLAGA